MRMDWVHDRDPDYPRCTRDIEKTNECARDARRCEYVPLVSTEWCCCVCWLVVVVLLFSREVTAVVLLASGEMQHFSRQDQDQSCLGLEKCCISPGRRFSISQPTQKHGPCGSRGSCRVDRCSFLDEKKTHQRDKCCNLKLNLTFTVTFRRYPAPW